MNNEEKNIPKALINPNPEGNNVPRRKTEESNNGNNDSLPEKDGLKGSKSEEKDLSEDSNSSDLKKETKNSSILDSAICKIFGISSIQKLKFYLIIA